MPGGYSGLFKGTRGARMEPITNGDRIRAKNNEEMAAWIAGYVLNHQEHIGRYQTATKAWLNWLRQPAETEGTE